MNMTNETTSYDVFLSYRHKPLDNRICKKVHTLLETFKPPKRFKQADIKRVFRDDEELPVAGVLSDTIAQALKSAKVLLVICSKDTPQSQWVDKEVRTFIELGRSEKIYALLIDGDPETSFPPSLKLVPGINTRTLNIKASEERHSNAKLKKELLKVISASTETPIDQLRIALKRRKLTRSFLAGFALSVFLILAGFYSLYQWVKASYYYLYAQREELVIGDVIQSIRTDLTTAVENIPEAAPALVKIINDNNEYLDRIIALDRDSEKTLKEKGTNFLSLARAYMFTNNKDATLEASLEAIEIFENIAKNSNKEEKILGVAISYNVTGTYMQALSDFKKAVEYYEKAATAYNKLYQISRNNSYINSQADCLNSIGVCYYLSENYKDAANSFLKEIDLRKESFDMTVEENRNQLAGLYSDTALCLNLAQEYKKASTYYDKAASLYQHLFEDTLDVMHHKSYTLSLYSLAINQTYIKEFNDAEYNLRLSLVEADKLVRESMPEFDPYYLSMYAMYDLLYAPEDKKEEALNLASTAYNANSNDPFIIHVYSYSLLINGYTHEASTLLKSHINENPSTARKVISDLELFIIRGRAVDEILQLKNSL